MRFLAGAVVFLGGLAAAIGLLVLSALFGLNGEQWDWWAWASWAGAIVVVSGAAFGSMQLAASGPGRAERTGWAAGLFGAALVVVSLSLMAHVYSDPYSGDLFWPHALAVVAFIGLALLVASLLWKVAR